MVGSGGNVGNDGRGGSVGFGKVGMVSVSLKVLIPINWLINPRIFM